MKRSEMINMIIRQLIKLEVGTTLTTPGRAEFLLMTFERFMNPKTFIESSCGGIYTAKELIEYCNIDGNFEWEPEDETK